MNKIFSRRISHLSLIKNCLRLSSQCLIMLPCLFVLRGDLRMLMGTVAVCLNLRFLFSFQLKESYKTIWKQQTIDGNHIGFLLPYPFIMFVLCSLLRYLFFFASGWFPSSTGYDPSSKRFLSRTKMSIEGIWGAKPFPARKYVEIRLQEGRSSSR